MKEKVIIVCLLLVVLVLSGCTGNNNEEQEIIYAEEKEISGTIFDVQITETFTIVVFERNFCLTFYTPSVKLLENYPFLDSFENAYTTMILLKDIDVTIHYVFYDGVNYFNYCMVNV